MGGGQQCNQQKLGAGQAAAQGSVGRHIDGCSRTCPCGVALVGRLGWHLWVVWGGLGGVALVGWPLWGVWGGPCGVAIMRRVGRPLWGGFVGWPLWYV